MRKIYIKEDKVKLLEAENSPDKVYLDYKMISWYDDDAYPFFYFNDGSLLVGEVSDVHGRTLFDYAKSIFDENGYTLIDDDDEEYMYGNYDESKYYTYDDVGEKSYEIRKNLICEGRIWVDNEVISLYQTVDKNVLRKVIDKLNGYFNIDLADLGFIALKDEVIPLMVYLIDENKNDTEKERVIHNLPSKEKKETEQMKNALKTQNDIKAKKFGEPRNNRSVPEAEYEFYKRYGMGDSVESKEVMDENIDLEVDSSEINLSSFKKKNELNPKFWNNDMLSSRVRLKLLDIADLFWDSLELSWVEPKDIILTGSICNYNWSKYSDIDLHILIDYNEISDKTEFVEEYFNTKKNEWNNDHEKLKIYGYPIELYVQDINEANSSSGVYSLEQNKWLMKPNHNSIKQIGLDKYKIKEKSAKYLTMIDDLIDEYKMTTDNHQIEIIGDKANKLIKYLRKLRKVGLEENGESDWRNIVYKICRRSGYLDKLYDLKLSTFDRINSIN